MSARLEPGAILLQLEQRTTRPLKARASDCEHRGAEGEGVPGGLPLDTPGVAESDQGVLVRMSFDGSLPTSRLQGEVALPGHYNFLLGNDRSLWQAHVPAFESIVYRGLYEGIDVRVREGSGLEYDLLLEPGADLDQVQVRCEGIVGLELLENGDLLMQTVLGPVRQGVPTTWEVLPDGRHRLIECRYRIIGQDRFAFDVVGRTPTLAMVIDPGLTWSTFLGGSGGEGLRSVAVGADGSITVVGGVSTQTFPVTPGAYATTTIGMADLTVTRLDPTGSSLIYSTYLGGSDDDVSVNSVAVDLLGRAVLAGSTFSNDYPTTPGAYDESFNGPAGWDDVFITCLSSAGDDLEFSTFFGGSNCRDVAHASTMADDGSVLVTGTTCATDFPTTPGAYKPVFTGISHDIFVARFDAQGSNLLASSLFGGTTDLDFPLAVASGPGATMLVGGESRSDDFPTTPGAHEESVLSFPPVLKAGFVSRLSADATTLEYSTFVGGQSTQFTSGELLGAQTSVTSIVASATGEYLVAGGTTAADLSVTPGVVQPTAAAKAEGFVGILNPAGTAFTSLTYLGGDSSDDLVAAELHGNGDVTVSGSTLSSDLPTTPGAFDPVNPGNDWVGFVARLDAQLSQVRYCTYLGEPSSASIFANGMALDDEGAAIVVGTATPFFPTTVGAFQPVFGGGIWDGFVSRIVTEPHWIDLGGALLGVSGRPDLAASGALCAGVTVTLSLSDAAPRAAANLVIGLSLLNSPFKGGTLVPNPDLLISGLPTDALGQLALSASWPPAVPSGAAFYFQFWISDELGPAGFSASNGLMGVVP